MFSLLLLISAVYAQDSAVWNSANFCDMWDRICNYTGAGMGATYTDMANCVASWPTDMNLQQCYWYHTMVSGTSTVTSFINTHCGHGAGADPCHTVITGAVLGGNYYTNAWNSAAYCNGITGSNLVTPFGVAQYDGVPDSTRNCWWYHLSVRQLMAPTDVGDTNEHCSHSSGYNSVPATQDGTTGCNAYATPTPEAAGFCGLYGATYGCGYLTHIDRLGSMNMANYGNCVRDWNMYSSARRQCVNYHSMVYIITADPTDAANHCEHASGNAPCDTDAGQPGNMEFCTAYAAFCGAVSPMPAASYGFADAANAYDNARCMTGFGNSVDNVQKDCVWYHLSVHILEEYPNYATDTNGHCQHAAGAAPCTAFTYVTTTAVVTTQAANTHGFILSIVFVIFAWVGN